MSVADREIIIPHDLTRGPLTAVRRILVQSSLAELKAMGFYEKYRSVVDPGALAEINDQIGPGWLAVELALAHYRACDTLPLSGEQLEKLGAQGGEKVASALLVTRAKSPAPGEKVSPWLALDAFWRMGRRLNEGGSSQYVKVGPTQLQIESLGNPLHSIPYYRTAQMGFLRQSFSALGVIVTEVKIMNYSASNGTIDTRVSWR